MSATIKDIAKIAGVSHSTVSRCLNDSPLISEKTKDRIKKIAKDMNFEFNSNARYLSTKKTGTIGIIIPEQEKDFTFSYYLILMIYDIQIFFEEASYYCIMMTSKNKQTGESNIQKLLSRKKVDGLIIVHPNIEIDVIKKIEQMEIPYIFLHFKPKLKEADSLNYVTTDHYKGGYIATEFLLKQGMQKILSLTILSNTLKDFQFEERTEGYKKALTDKGIDYGNELIHTGQTTFQYGYDFIKENISLIKNVDAIFAQADVIAVGVINALNEIGIKVPEDISVIGYDDIEMALYVRPKLTTIHQPINEHVSLACGRLIEMIEKKNVDKHLQKIFEPELIIRESCKITI